MILLTCCGYGVEVFISEWSSVYCLDTTYAFSAPLSFPTGNRAEILGSHEKQDKKLPSETTQTRSLDEKGKCLYL